MSKEEKLQELRERIEGFKFTEYYTYYYEDSNGKFEVWTDIGVGERRERMKLINEYRELYENGK